MFESPTSPPPKPFSLAKLAAIFATVFVIAFGLCSASVGSANKWGKAASYLVPGSLITEAICFIGLLVLALVALFRAIFPRN